MAGPTLGVTKGRLRSGCRRLAHGLSVSVPPPQRSWWRPWCQVQTARALLLIGAPLVFFHRAVFTSEAFLSRDMLRTYAPLLSFWAARIKAAAWPGWYPYDALGQSYVGMVVSHAFHPSNLLALIAPVALALKLTTLACFPAAAL